MSTSTESPILDFLMSNENLHAVVEVIRYAEEIRERVEKQFWDKLERELVKHQPALLGSNFSWAQHHMGSKPGSEFGLDARISPVNEKIQALSYRIEIRYDYFSVGLWWLKTPAEKDFAELLKKREVKVLQADLQRKRHGEVQPPWWFWWECWEGNLYHDDDPWSWFVKERDEAWYKDKATKFWGFVGETHALVMEANKALKQFK